MKLLGKVAVVTGAANGIGKEIARIFLREGAKVVIADFDRHAAAAAAAELGGSGTTIGVAMDVTNEAQVEAGIYEAITAFGRIDVLVSNAGIQIVSPLKEFPFDKWKLLLAIHLDGAFLTTKAVLRQMYKQGSGGTIIYMGSVHSGETSVLMAPYVTAKHGLIGLAKFVAEEGAKHGIRANVICPGFIHTPLVDKLLPQQANGLEGVIIENLLSEAVEDDEFTTFVDVAETALFIASFESNALTGQSLVVNHGWFI